MPPGGSSCFIYSKSCRVTSRSDRNFGSAHRMALPLDFTAARTMERSFPQGPWRQCAMTSCVSHWRDTVDFTMLRKSKQFSHVYFWALCIIYHNINYRIITKNTTTKHLWVWRIFDFCTTYVLAITEHLWFWKLHLYQHIYQHHLSSQILQLSSFAMDLRFTATCFRVQPS